MAAGWKGCMCQIASSPKPLGSFQNLGEAEQGQEMNSVITGIPNLSSSIFINLLSRKHCSRESLLLQTHRCNDGLHMDLTIGENFSQKPHNSCLSCCTINMPKKEALFPSLMSWISTWRPILLPLTSGLSLSHPPPQLINISLKLQAAMCKQETLFKYNSQVTHVLLLVDSLYTCFIYKILWPFHECKYFIWVGVDEP